MSFFEKTADSKAVPYIELHILLLVYSLGGICSKFAGKEDFLSLRFVALYGLLLLDLAVYALVWQHILKKIPLTVAYCNKAVGIIWGMMWGVIVFGETLTLTNIIGAVVVLAGVVLMVSDDE